jgi:hypothetical protein
MNLRGFWRPEQRRRYGDSYYDTLHCATKLCESFLLKHLNLFIFSSIFFLIPSFIRSIFRFFLIYFFICCLNVSQVDILENFWQEITYAEDIHIAVISRSKVCRELSYRLLTVHLLNKIINMDSHDSTDVSCFLCNLKSERKLHELLGTGSGEF